jgi:hypothetical protein
MTPQSGLVSCVVWPTRPYYSYNGSLQLGFVGWN